MKSRKTVVVISGILCAAALCALAVAVAIKCVSIYLLFVIFGWFAIGLTA